MANHLRRPGPGTWIEIIRILNIYTSRMTWSLATSLLNGPLDDKSRLHYNTHIVKEHNTWQIAL